MNRISLIGLISLISLIFLAQLIFILNSTSQIRYEELADGVRNVYWLDQGLVYDGTSTSVGWYVALLIVYKMFGFGLFYAKYFRLFLELTFLISLGYILKKYLGEKKAILPFLTIGFSPTLLFYNTLQTPHGTDLLYFPIVFALLIQQKTWARLVGWMLAMVAWMSYPTFIFYLPVLLFLHLREEKLQLHLGGVLLRLGAFFAPLILAFLFIKNRSLLILDPQLGSGLFRGAGTLSKEAFFINLSGFLNDLFNKGSSYHFDLYKGEFSLIFPVLTVVAVLILGWKIRGRWGIGLIGGIIAVLLVVSFTSDPSGAPGMRRYTPALAAFYALFVMVWWKAGNWGIRGIWGIRVILGLLLLHHLIVYPINLIHLKDPSPFSYPIWFNTQDTPAKSLQGLVETVQQKDLKLVCKENGQPIYCRLAEVYAVVAGSCLWNHLNCHRILGYDLAKGQFIPLSTDLWNSYYFEH